MEWHKILIMIPIFALGGGLVFCTKSPEKREDQPKKSVVITPVSSGKLSKIISPEEEKWIKSVLKIDLRTTFYLLPGSKKRVLVATEWGYFPKANPMAKGGKYLIETHYFDLKKRKEFTLKEIIKDEAKLIAVIAGEMLKKRNRKLEMERRDREEMRKKRKRTLLGFARCGLAWDDHYRSQHLYLSNAKIKQDRLSISVRCHGELATVSYQQYKELFTPAFREIMGF